MHWIHWMFLFYFILFLDIYQIVKSQVPKIRADLLKEGKTAG